MDLVRPIMYSPRKLFPFLSVAAVLRQARGNMFIDGKARLRQIKQPGSPACQSLTLVIVCNLDLPHPYILISSLRGQLCWWVCPCYSVRDG